MKNPREKKKTYVKPKIVDLGKVQDIARAISNGNVSDNMGGKRMSCLADPHYIVEHNSLLKDQRVQEGFLSQIQSTVKPGDVVLDLGTGSGLHALFALKAGASKVYAVDSGEIIHVAEEVVRANGFSEKVQFIRGRAEEIELPEKVDVIVTNIGFYNMVRVLPIAIKKFLKPGGQIIPSHYQVSMVPSGSTEFYDDQVNFWDNKQYDLDFSAFRKLAVNTPQYLHADPATFLSEPQNSNIESFSEELDGAKTWTFDFEMNQDAQVNGITGWYSFFANSKEIMSTRPPLSVSKEIWMNYFFPLPQSVTVKKGDRLKAIITMINMPGVPNLLWKWQMKLNDVRIADQSSAFEALALLH